ncbi:hypothetical protein BC941DRAFT_269111 [Chlamydoabsidia padenii]|nr:hypothetical protein BC941DRAFT_269111 [Chlamydoabsidia padenii]
MLNIYTAALEGKQFVVQQILEKEPNALNGHDEDERTPLHWASSGGHDALVLFLIEKGADVNAKDDVSIKKKKKRWGWLVCVIHKVLYI